MLFIKNNFEPAPAKFFENENFWDGRIAKDPWHVEKFRIMHAMIPVGVKSILDIGCGDGTFLSFVKDKYHCVGIDQSFQALRQLTYPAVRASIENLPIKKECFDLIVISEILEHLPTPIFGRAISNISELSTKYLMVGVPYREKLLANSATCKKCKKLSNLNTHIRSFSGYTDIINLFPAYNFRSVLYCARQTHIKSNLFIYFDKLLRGGTTNLPFFICPFCGNEEPLRAHIKRLWPLWRILEGLAWRMKRETIPWWMVVLLEKNV